MDARAAHAHQLNGTTLIVVGGALDKTQTLRLWRVIRQALCEPTAHILLDLRGVRLIDLSAAALIGRARIFIEQCGGRLRVIGACGAALEVLEILGLAKDLGAYDPPECWPERPALPCCRTRPAPPSRPVPAEAPPAQVGPKLPTEEVQALLAQAAELPDTDPHRQRLRCQAIEIALPATYRFAHRYRCRGEPDDDLRQAAALGLVKAVHRYDPRRGTRFDDYAVPAIRGELRRHFRDTGRWARLPRPLQDLWLDARGAASELRQHLGRPPSITDLATRLGVPAAAVATALRAVREDPASPTGLRQPAAEDHFGQTEQGYDRIEDWAAIKTYLPCLPQRTRQILLLRFVHDMSQREIAARLGLSQVHVSRLLNQAYHMLRAALMQDRPMLGRSAGR